MLHCSSFGPVHCTWPMLHAAGSQRPAVLLQSAGVAHVSSSTQLVKVELQCWSTAPEQRISSAMQTGIWHAPFMHSGTLAQAEPLFTKSVRPALQICGCAWLHCFSFTAQNGGEHMPAEHSADVSHAVPALSQPFWSALQICGCSTSQRF